MLTIEANNDEWSLNERLAWVEGCICFRVFISCLIPNLELLIEEEWRKSDFQPSSSTITIMAKGRGSKSTKLQAAREQPRANSQSPEKPDTKGKSKQVSDELRQAVKDLGGDDDDLDLIAGIDSDEEQDVASSSKGNKPVDGAVDEVRTTKVAVGQC